MEQLVVEVLLPWAVSREAVPGEYEVGSPHGLRPSFSSGTDAYVRGVVAQEAEERFQRAIPDEDARDLGRVLSAALEEEVPDEQSLLADAAPPVALRGWAARSDVQGSVAASLRDQRSTITRGLREAFEHLASLTEPVWERKPGADWSVWLNRTIKVAANWRSSWRALDWDALPRSAVSNAFQDLAEDYGTDEAYDVVFAVNGIDAQGERWSDGEIVWFAESEMDLGQPWHRSDENRSEALRAWLNVRAPSEASAPARALTTLEAALSALTFAFSVDRQVGGLRPSIGRDALVGSAETGFSRSGGRREREELEEVLNARDDDLRRFSKLYAPLIAKEPGRRSELERRVLRAFSWYREGRWEPNPVNRFLSYFVAFEQIFLAGERGQKYRLAEEAAPLTSSWIDARLPEHHSLEKQFSRVHELHEYIRGGWLEERLQGDHNFEGWREDVRPFLDPDLMDSLRRSARRAQAATPDDAQAVAEYADQLERFIRSRAGADARINAERLRWRFSLHLLDQRRNEIAHEAFVSGPDMDLYARAMEDALERVLKKLPKLVIDHPDRIKSIEDARQWHAIPWR